ncbi:peptidase M20 [Pokkaliibacter plantistimulans]|uniref:Peptidase M20 n=1 Tax=Pokkaliibacter plantistimulans TaxID=1635171 RepID=A0ABX5M4B7_9GAMM|nr:amidohydrolase [Pokkaliibacter plantistimulans]PXF32436.1 peptidase M20 [Pokkaliibacter plantistimulans]
MSFDHAYWTGLRRELHQQPELSGEEAATAQRILALFRPWQADEVHTGLGKVDGQPGTGMAFVFNGAEPGPTTLIRGELDALPIQEKGQCQHQSCIPGVAHLCGHDGHMTMVASLGATLSRQRPIKGRVILAFQPAEETGAGAVSMVQDPDFASLLPDYAFALHNVPGLPLGKVVVKAGSFNCASRGMIIRLTGKTSHAAHPENGRSPALALARLIQSLSALPQQLEGFNRVTIIHALLGEVAFGTSPGDAVLMATLRTETNDAMNFLVEAASRLAAEEAERDGLEWALEWQDVFRASVNSEEGAAQVVAACHRNGIEVEVADKGYRWSEDFGIFTEVAKNGAMFALGAGERSPQLHNPDYDFPDALLPIGNALFLSLIRQINGLQGD